VPRQGLVIETAHGSPGEVRGEGLLGQLARTLDARGVAYCQWKGHWSAHRWARGQGDVDLLVDHGALTAFRDIAGELGFKSALPSGERQIPSLESFVGYDPAEHHLLHLHVHYRLIVGEYWRTAYRIPIERAILETAVSGPLFRAPAPPFQLIVFVLRMILRQRGRIRRTTRMRWLSGIQIQLASLEGSCDREAVRAILDRCLPSIDLPFFERCVRSLRGQGGLLERAVLPAQLHRRLRAHALRPSLTALTSAAVEKFLPAGIAHGRFNHGMRLAGGGTVLALVGGDGSGKSTCTRRLGAWLAPWFPTRCAHLGNSPRSLMTLIVGAALKAEQAAYRVLRPEARGISTLELLRHLCTARDCFRLYEKVRRFAARGGIAICDRYPVPQLQSHVGPCIPALVLPKPTALARLLLATEVSYYKRILPPDALFVLRLDPDLAVLRKPDEPADYVRDRNRITWTTEWSGTAAQVIDAGRPLPEVLSDLKVRIWSVL
jgi:hypothetical protein